MGRLPYKTAAFPDFLSATQPNKHVISHRRQNTKRLSGSSCQVGKTNAAQVPSTKDADLVDVAVEVPVGEGGCVLLPLALGVALVAEAEAGIDKKVDARVVLGKDGSNQNVTYKAGDLNY